MDQHSCRDVFVAAFLIYSKSIYYPLRFFETTPCLIEIDFVQLQSLKIQIKV